MGTPLAVTFSIEDDNGVALPAADQIYHLTLSPAPQDFTITPSVGAVALASKSDTATFSLRVNAASPVYSFTISNAGRFLLSAGVGSAFPLLVQNAASGLPDFFLTAPFGINPCTIGACGVTVYTYNTATGAATSAAVSVNLATDSPALTLPGTPYSIAPAANAVAVTLTAASSIGALYNVTVRQPRAPLSSTHCLNRSVLSNESYSDLWRRGLQREGDAPR